ncbi:MAG: nuclear transport factor 2 family protein [Candidatus Zixiibacteriota bacterium]
MDSAPIAVVHAFIAAINEGDVNGLSRLMADDHTFVDSLGHVETRRDKMTAGWATYFGMFPDYRIEVETIFEHGDMVAVFGRAVGTYNGKRGLVLANRVVMPAAWKAIVANGKIRHWQVYADWSEGLKTIEADNAQM